MVNKTLKQIKTEAAKKLRADAETLRAAAMILASRSADQDDDDLEDTAEYLDNIADEMDGEAELI